MIVFADLAVEVCHNGRLLSKQHNNQFRFMPANKNYSFFNKIQIGPEHMASLLS